MPETESSDAERDMEAELEKQLAEIRARQYFMESFVGVEGQ